MTIDKIKGAIFDLDGTLFDSMRVWNEVDRRFLARRSLPLPDDYNEAIKVLNFPDAAKYTKIRFNLPESEEEIMQEWLDMTAVLYEKEVVLKPYALEYLSLLRKRGVKLGIATSNKPENFNRVFKRYGIGHYFCAAVTTEETRNKSFPDVYLHTALKMGVKPEECAVFEDILVGIQSAKNAGFYAVAVHDDSSTIEREHLHTCADLYITSFKELL